VGYHSGVLDSLCFTGEAISVLQWGRLSDKIGRRPVLFVCTLGLASALTSFGLSTTFAGLAVSRAFEGLLNGNSGTIKAILAELAGGDEHKLAKVFSMMPMVWAVGATIG
jgi:MFS family permease